jgi:hypothetical protein
MLFLYALGTASRTKSQVVQSIVVLPIVGLKKKLTVHFVSTGSLPAVDMYDWLYINITRTTSHEIKAYTQDDVSCKINFTLIRRKVKNDGWQKFETWSENIYPDFHNFKLWVFQFDAFADA